MGSNPTQGSFFFEKEKAVLGVYICLALIYHVLNLQSLDLQNMETNLALLSPMDTHFVSSFSSALTFALVRSVCQIRTTFLSCMYAVSILHAAYIQLYLNL